MILHPPKPKKKRKSKKAVEVFGKFVPIRTTKEWVPPMPYRVETKYHPSKIDDFLQNGGPSNAPVKPSYSGELEEREKAARLELERKKKFVAITCNKGAYQFIGENPSEQVLKDLGR